MSPELIGFFCNKKSVTFQNTTFLPNTQFIMLKIYTLIYKTSVGVFLFFVLNLCAVTMGEERKTVDNCFSRTKSTKQREMKQGYALRTS